MKVLVASLTGCTDSIGTTETRYVTDGVGWATSPTDTPANTYIEPRLMQAGAYKRELFSGDRMSGPVRPSFGELVLNNADGELDAWTGYGVDGRQIKLWYMDEGAAFPPAGDPALICYGNSIQADFDEIRVSLRDRLQLFDKPFCNRQFAGTGGLEGPSTYEGRSMPRSASDPGYHPVLPVDVTNGIYLVTSSGAGGLEAQFVLYEGGVVVTRGADYASASDCTTNAPAAGQCRFWFGTGGDGPIYVRVATTPAAELRCFSLGYNTAGVAINLAEEVGIAGASSGPAPIVYVDDPTTSYLAVASEAAKRGPYFFGMTRLDTYQVGLVTAPGATAVHTFTQHNARNFKRVPPAGVPVPFGRFVYSAGRTWPSQVKSGVSNTLIDYLSRAPWYWSVDFENAGVLAKHPSAPPLRVEDRCRSVQNYLDADAIRDRYVALFGVERDGLTLTADFDDDVLALDLHDTVEVKVPRLGLSAGKKFRIASVEHRWSTREINFALWG